MLPVTLEEELFNESYLMKGLPFDMRIRYNAVAGSISLEYQMLPDGIVLVPWTLQGGGYLSRHRVLVWKVTWRKKQRPTLETAIWKM